MEMFTHTQAAEFSDQKLRDANVKHAAAAAADSVSAPRLNMRNKRCPRTWKQRERAHAVCVREERDRETHTAATKKNIRCADGLPRKRAGESSPELTWKPSWLLG